MWRIGLFGVVVLAGCTCGGDGPARVEGETPYLRCHLAEPTSEDVREVGDLTLRRDGRGLTIEGIGDRYRVAVGAGPLVTEAPAAELVFVIDGDPTAVGGSAPVVVVAGAGERVSIEDDSPRFVDGTVLRSIRAGPVEWIPVAGTPDGRYARVDEPCGFGEADLDEWSLPDAEAVRVLVSWAGPADAPATMGLLGVDAGSTLVRRIMTDTGTEAALFAWPTTSVAPPPEDASCAVAVAIRPIDGPVVTRADGARIRPGWTVLEASAAGLARAADGGREPP